MLFDKRVRYVKKVKSHWSELCLFLVCPRGFCHGTRIGDDRCRSIDSEKKRLNIQVLQISQLHILLRSAMPRPLRKNPISAAFTWDTTFSVITQGSWPQMRIGKKTNYKTDSFAVFESSHFVTTGNKAHAELRLLFHSAYYSHMKVWGDMKVWLRHT